MLTRLHLGVELASVRAPDLEQEALRDQFVPVQTALHCKDGITARPAWIETILEVDLVDLTSFATAPQGLSFPGRMPSEHGSGSRQLPGGYRTVLVFQT